MSLTAQVVIAVLGGGVVGACGPAITRALPEPIAPAAGKLTYRAVADLAGARWFQPVAAAVAAGVLAACIGRPELLPIWVLLAGVGSALAWIDWHTRYLPFRMTTGLYCALWAALVIAAVATGDVDLVIKAAAANVVVYAVFWVIYLVGNRFGGGFGFGDVRLAAIIAVALAPLGGTAVFVGLYAGFVLGAAGGLLTRLLKRGDTKTVAFGPYMLLGAVVGAVFVR